ncbi:MAG: MFS transporter [Bacteroidia bacterium]
MANFIQKSLRLYVDSYSGHPPEVWILSIVTFINRLGMMVVPFLTVYLNTILHFELYEAGFLVAAFGIGSFAGTWVGGRLSDRIGPRWVIFSSLVLGGSCLILLQFVHETAGLATMLLLTGFFGDALRPASMATIGYYAKKERMGSAMALFRLAINLGFSAAPAIGGFLVAAFSYAALFWVDGLTCMLAAVFFIFASTKWRPVTRKEPYGENIEVEKAEAASLPPQQNKAYLLFLLATFLMGFGFVQWFHSFAVFLKNEWGLDERYSGAALALNGLVIVLLEMPLVHYIEQLNKNMRAFSIGVALIALSFLPFVLPAWYGFAILAILLMTIGEILNLPFSSTFALKLAPEHMRGEYSAWYGMTWSLTNVAGPALGLAFVGQFGWPAFWIGLSALGMSSLILYKKAGIGSTKD